MSDFAPVVEPEAVTAMREAKQALLLREAAQMEAMTRRWLRVENSLDAQISLLVQDVVMLSSSGGHVNQGWLLRQERYQLLMSHTQAEVDGFIEFVERLVCEGQAEVAKQGIEDAVENISLSFEDGFGSYFEHLPPEATEYMVGLTGMGAPVGRLLWQRLALRPGADGLDSWLRLTQTLIDGTTRGWNPYKTAQRMKDDLAGGLQKALVIARTEQLRVYREATRQQYIRSGVVEGYKRLCAHDSRVCVACLALDGEFYSLDIPMFDHPQGRCTTIAVLKGAPEKKWLAGEDWLKTQPEEVQQSILGKARFEAWKAGEIDFRKLATKTHDATWGMGLKVTPFQHMNLGTVNNIKIERYEGQHVEQYVTVSPDIRGMYPDGTPGKESLISKKVILESVQNGHIYDDHPHDQEWLSNHSEEIIRAIEEPEYIDNKPRSKRKGRFAVAHVIDITNSTNGGHPYLNVVIQYGLLDKDDHHIIFTAYRADERFMFDDEGLKNRWLRIKK